MTTTIIPQKKQSHWTASLLVSGACIGGGMLAMPVQTAEAGFFISLFALFVCWGFMSFTGLLLVEIALWLKNSTHFSSMAAQILGSWGRGLCLIVYLLMNYLSLVAYTAGSSALLDQWIFNLTGISLGYGGSCILFTLVFGSAVYLGSLFIGRLNALLMISMAITYFAVVGISLPNIHIDQFSARVSWTQGVASMPLILAAYSYQMLVPSVCSYLNYDLRVLKKSILIGTTIPFLVYTLWLFIVHGIVPFEGANGLQQAFIKGTASTEPLKAHLAVPCITLLADGFAFFALVTSYLGLSLALFDFIGDFFKSLFQKEMQTRHNLVTFLSLFPTLILAILFPRALLQFLDLSGGFGDALLSGLIPISMVWVGRYHKKLLGEYRAPGGKLALLLAGCFALFIFLLQWVKLL